MEMPTFLVSHDLAEIFKLSNRVIHLDAGQLIKTGSPHEVFGVSDDRLCITGQVIDKFDQGVITVVTVAVGAEVSRIALSKGEAAELMPGDRVTVSAKAFNPTVGKLEGRI